MLKVNIVTVTYNSSEHIKDCVESVNAQSYKNISHIFIDGNSTDNTQLIIETYSKRKCVIISEEDDGIYDALNKGIKYCKEGLVFILHSDDILAGSEVVSSIVQQAENNANCKIFYTDIAFCKRDDTSMVTRSWKSSLYSRRGLEKGWHIPHPGFVAWKEVYNTVGEFNTSYRVASDYDFMTRCFQKYGDESLYLELTSVYFREGGTSTRFKGIIESFIDIRRSAKANGLNVDLFSLLKYRYILKLKQRFQ